MKVRVKTVVKIAAVLVVGLLATAVAVLKSMDFDQYRGLVAQRVEAATGRELDIRGHVDLRVLTLAPSLTMADVSFANAPWGSRPEMVSLARLEAEVALIPLFLGQVEVNRLVLVKPDILLETDESGRGNWQFAKAPAGPAPDGAKEPGTGAPGRLPAVAAVRIEDGRLVYRDGKTGETTTVGLQRFEAEAESAASPLEFDLAGTFNAKAFEAEGTVGALATLRRGDQPFPVNLTAEAGGATVRVNGAIARPAEGGGLALDVTAAGDELADLGGFLGAPLPAVGKYRLQASLTGGRERIEIGNMEAALGDSDLSGKATVVAAERPAVQATLDSDLLDLAALTAIPRDGAEARPAPEGGKAPAEKGRVFSDAPLALAGLGAVDADVTLTAARVVTKGPELADVRVELALKDGRLAATPLSANLADGRVTGALSVDAAAAPGAAVTARLRAEGLDLAALAGAMGVEERITGKGNFDAALEGRGASVHEIMAGLSGRTDLAVGEGTISNTYMEILIADLAQAALGERAPAKLNCAVSRFEIANGIAVSRALVMDTETVTIAGEGDIDLGKETIDLILTPEPKEVSLVNLAAPVRIEGSLASPSIYPDPAGVAKKAATAAVGTMTGVGALGGLLAPLVAGKATGGETNPCLELLGGGTAAEGPAAAQEEKGAGEVMMEGVGDGLRDIEKGLKGLFE